MEVTPNPHLSEEGKAEYLAEVKRRQTLQPLGISEPETILDIQVDFFSNQNGGKHHYIII
jgi:hypothetical protein